MRNRRRELTEILRVRIAASLPRAKPVAHRKQADKSEMQSGILVRPTKMKNVETGLGGRDLEQRRAPRLSLGRGNHQPFPFTKQFDDGSKRI